MIHSRTHRTPWYKYVLIAPVFVFLIFTFSCQPDAEEVGQESVAQSYEEVQRSLAQIDQQLQQNVGESEKQRLTIQKEQLREQLTQLPDADGVFTVVEHRPEPADGLENFYRFIGNNIRYPAEARQAQIEGKVFVQFVVNQYGELTKVEAIKGIGQGCDEEAVRVVKTAPAWKPGTNHGKAVDVRMVLPITFKLGNGENNTTLNNLPTKEEPNSLAEMVVVGY